MIASHWTGLEVGAVTFAGAALCGWLSAFLMERADRRAERGTAPVPRRVQGARFVALPGWPGPASPLPARPASGGGVVMPPRPAPLPVAPECLDESQVAQDATLLIAAAVALCRRDAEVRANAALMDEYAQKFPMKQRPRLVDRKADTEINPLPGDPHDR